ncbi:MAG: hypothetical protein J7L55_02590, partial [Desulfurococcales archaeon]|nr:hypothetical protein [Desulfurococcales archaeon]
VVKPVFESVKKAYARVRRVYWWFSTDLVHPSGELGVPGFGLGPGDERLAHKPDEKVGVVELRKCVEEYLMLVKALNRALP